MTTKQIAEALIRDEQLYISQFQQVAYDYMEAINRLCELTPMHEIDCNAVELTARNFLRDQGWLKDGVAAKPEAQQNRNP